ncbi:hypothetical protein [Sphingosinithalassobacter sp. CS137]|uniref:hypothetical protein n=1 Tax=Sphingosinithalassobacter sp. CS137 TaxID=2762748 RepID=UPI00165DD1EF|nr:hypothetical protein [Sphingosinithalassobacter sp. CS137]
MPDPLPWRPEFLAALRLLARVSEAMAARGLPRPVLVGGGAVEFYTGSAVMTGDIDVTSPVQPELEEELQRLGFVRPSGPGKATRGWVHPDLGLGFEVVGSSPMGGTPDPVRIRLINAPGADGALRILSLEDMIADRMGQYASGTAPDLLAQARQLADLYPELDLAYLEQRIRTETLGDHGIEDLRG